MDDNINSYCSDENLLNYTQVMELQLTEKYNVAPRYHKCHGHIAELPDDIGG